MAIDSIGRSAPTFAAHRAQRRQKFEADFQELGTALGSGDLAAARAAFEKIQKNAPKRPEPRERDGDRDDQKDAPPNARANPFEAIGKALEKGDIGAAQEAFAALAARFQAKGPRGQELAPGSPPPAPTNLDQFAAQIGTGKISADSVDVYA